MPTITGRRRGPPPAESQQAAIGAAFKQARERARFSLRDTARTLDVSINTLRWHETGAQMLRADVIRSAAILFGVDAATLLVMPEE